MKDLRQFNSMCAYNIIGSSLSTDDACTIFENKKNIYKECIRLPSFSFWRRNSLSAKAIFDYFVSSTLQPYTHSNAIFMPFLYFFFGLQRLEDFHTKICMEIATKKSSIKRCFVRCGVVQFRRPTLLRILFIILDHFFFLALIFAHQKTRILDAIIRGCFVHA